MDRIRLNASEWMDFRNGEKKCFLLTNGLGGDRKSTRLNSSHSGQSRMPSSA